MSEPANQKLYQKVKNEIYKQYPVHSAYRSSLLVNAYKKAGGAYKGKKNDNTGLAVWYKEKWTNQRGESGYKYDSDVYRPTVRINKNTPTTFKELTKGQIERAKKEKKDQGRVNKFDK